MKRSLNFYSLKKPSPGRKQKAVIISLAVSFSMALAGFTAIPVLMIGGMVNQHVEFSQVWSGAEYDLDAKNSR